MAHQPQDLEQWMPLAKRSNRFILHEIQDQIDEATCLAVASVGTVEARYNKSQLNKKDWRAFSPLYAIDQTYKTQHRVRGTSSFKAVEHLMKRGGICLDDKYKRGKKTHQVIRGLHLHIREGVREDDPNERLILRLLQDGPVVGVLRELYEGEYGDGAGAEFGNHAIIIIGYGSTADGRHFFYIRNSYGYQWCDEGFSKVLRKTSTGRAKSLFRTIWYPEDVSAHE
ncbi:hypothetical protein DM860_007941 [Cuscuta australis]|uniref:Peptidase C1A papain C-terminal domain-containing protein n=1 Tax=Cuscuta australis TaxID=267555 RepID=A0A328DX03_9ASTE|nr:hypothetical protein DM860_007941 [Cuscuta australis]